MALLVDNRTVPEESIYGGHISYASYLLGPANEPIGDPTFFQGGGSDFDGFSNSLRGFPRTGGGSGRRTNSTLSLNMQRNPFRWEELDRCFMRAAGDSIGGATVQLLVPEIAIRDRGFYGGHVDDVPPGWTIIYLSSDFALAEYEGPAETSGDAAICLMAVFETNGQLLPRIIYTTSVATAIDQAVIVPIEAADIARAYLDSMGADSVFYEFIVTPPIDLDVTGNTGFDEDMHSLHDAMLPFGAMTYDEDFNGDVGQIEWKDFYWNDPSLSGLEVRYAGDFTLPSRARLVAQPHITRQDV